MERKDFIVCVYAFTIIYENFSYALVSLSFFDFSKSFSRVEITYTWRKLLLLINIEKIEKTDCKDRFSNFTKFHVEITLVKQSLWKQIKRTI